jgi:hypothetical protein
MFNEVWKIFFGPLNDCETTGSRTGMDAGRAKTPNLLLGKASPILEMHR